MEKRKFPGRFPIHCTEKTIRSALKSYTMKYHQISGKQPKKMGYRAYKFILVSRIYAKPNYLIRKSLSIEAKTECLKIWKLMVALLYWIAKLELETIKVEITEFPISSQGIRLPTTEIWKFGPRWQTKYASGVGVGVDFRLFSKGDFLSRCP